MTGGLPDTGGALGFLGGAGALDSALSGPTLPGFSPNNTLLGAFSKVPWKTPQQIAAEQLNSSLSTEPSAYGLALPLIRGSVYLQCMTIWRSAVREIDVDTTTSGGKGGGGGGSTSSAFSGYEVDIALAICDNVMHDQLILLRLWADMTTVLFDNTTGKPVTTVRTPNLHFYNGSQVVPNATLVKALGKLNTPAFVRTCYIVLTNLNVTPFGGRVPIFHVEVSGSSTDGVEPDRLIPYVEPISGDALISPERTAVDWILGYIYTFQADTKFHTNSFTVIVLSLDTQTELWRVKIKSALFKDYRSPVALSGLSQLIYAAQYNDNLWSDVSVDSETGIVHVLSAPNAHWTEWIGALPLNTKDSSYLLVGNWSAGGMSLATYATATGKITFLTRGDTNASDQRFYTFGPAYQGKARLYAASGSHINEITYTNGHYIVRHAYSFPATVNGLYFDTADDNVVVSGPLHMLKFIPSGGELVYDTNPIPGANYMAIYGGIYNKFPSPVNFHYSEVFAGHALVLTKSATDTGVYKIDTSDGTLEQ